MSRIKQARRRLGLTQVELASAAGVSPATVTKIELGNRKPQGRTMRKLATVLGVEVADLVEEEEVTPGRVLVSSSDIAELEGGTRLDLVLLGLDVHHSMLGRIFDPRNTSKGNEWSQMGWMELAEMLEEEVREMREEAMLGDPEAAMREAGDVLAVVCMLLDKIEEAR